MRLLAAVGVIAVVVIIATGVYFFGGFYNVSAAVDDPDLMNWTLVHIREASINRWADATPPIKLDDPATIRQGAIEFAEHGCANCHGAPGVKWAKFSEGLNPGPPDLKESTSDEAPAHVFWVVSNGIKMTAMPSFSKAGVPDEDIWEIVAFIKNLPNISEADYKAWTAPPPTVATPSPAQDAPPPAQNPTPPARQ